MCDAGSRNGTQVNGTRIVLDRQIAFGGAAHDGEEVHDLVLHLIPVGFGLDQALETVDGVIERRTQLTKFVSGFYVRLLRKIAAPEGFGDPHKVSHRRDDDGGQNDGND